MTGIPRIPDADPTDLAEQQVDVVDTADPIEPPDDWEAREADEADVAEQLVEIGYDDDHEPAEPRGRYRWVGSPACPP
jgi:hypothetical protein